MKRSLSLILALLMVLTSMSFAPAKANENEVKYILADGIGAPTEYNDAASLIRDINAIADDDNDNKAYTLTLKDDLELSEGLKIKNKFIINGNGRTMKPVDNFDGTMIGVLDGKKADIEIYKLKVNGRKIEDCNFLESDSYEKDSKVYISGSEFYNFKGNWDKYLLKLNYVSLTMDDCHVHDNEDDSRFIMVKSILKPKEDIKASITNCTFYNNSFECSLIDVYNIGELTVKNTHFEKIKNKQDASLYAGSVDRINIEDSKFINCKGYLKKPTRNRDKMSGAVRINGCNSATIKNVTFSGNEAENDGALSIGVYQYGSSNVNVIDCIFEKNRGKESGALRFSKYQPPAMKLLNSNSLRQTYSDPEPAKIKITNSRFINNESKTAGAINVDQIVDLSVSDCEFTENRADETLDFGEEPNTGSGSGSGSGSGYPYGTPIYMPPASGGAIRFLSSNDPYGPYRLEAKLEVSSSTFTDNYASRLGGAIYYKKVKLSPPPRLFALESTQGAPAASSPKNIGPYFIYKDPQETTYYDEANIYEGLSIAQDVVFKRNRAGYGFYNPPKNFADFTNIQFKQSSLEGKLVNQKDDGTWFNVRSILNNYDVNYINPVTTTTYDADGRGNIDVEEAKDTKDLSKEITKQFPGYDGQMYDYTVDYVIKDREVDVLPYAKTKLRQMDRTDPWNSELDGSDKTYTAGSKETLKGNFYAFAKAKEQGKKYIILTLDENYRGGKITDKEVMPGDMIEPHLYKPKRRGHTFKGWSYNKKHLDKVHYDDRIYEPTTIYAIWDEVEEEPEEIKGQEHKAYIFGYPDGTVRPNGEITRAEAAAMLARLLEIESIGSAEAPSFPDTPSAWYNKAINAVVQRGIMKGYPDGTFKPNDAITRAEFTQMISTIDNKPYGTAPFADVVGHWAERPIGSEYQAGRIAGYPDGTFRPDNHITRCEAAVILNKIFERNFDAMSLMKCKNPQMIKYFIDLDASFWGYNDMVEATNTHEYIRRYTNRVEENWLEIK